MKSQVQHNTLDIEVITANDRQSHPFTLIFCNHILDMAIMRLWQFSKTIFFVSFIYYLFGEF